VPRRALNADCDGNDLGKPREFNLKVKRGLAAAGGNKTDILMQGQTSKSSADDGGIAVLDYPVSARL